MKKIKVIKNVPVRLPILSTIVGYLLLDNIGVNGYIWGAFIVIVIIAWAFMIALIYYAQEKIDIFPEQNEPEKPHKKSKFQERLENMKNN